jgi:hypothetical protein
VCEKAKIIDADLVVMASHRKGRLQEFFVGSVTNYCLHHSKVPLLVYKGPKETDINTKYFVDISKKEKETSSSQYKEGKTPSIDFEKTTLKEDERERQRERERDAFNKMLRSLLSQREVSFIKLCYFLFYTSLNERSFIPSSLMPSVSLHSNNGVVAL